MIPAMIVPILTRPELLQRMLDSIDYSIEHLVIIDNGHVVDKVVTRKVERVHILNMPSNFGVAGSWNLGIKSLPFAPWWLIANFDLEWPAGSLDRFAQQANQDIVLLAEAQPPWCAFTVGANVVDKVGLFDESFHPAYFEDDDYGWRCHHAGMQVIQSDIPVAHRNSSTVAEPRYKERNLLTFGNNAQYHHGKRAAGDLSEGRWSLSRRRANSWD